MAKAKKLPSGNYRVRVYMGKDENGKDHYKSFTAPTKKEAEAAAAMYSVKRKEEKSRILTVGEVIDKYIELKENVLSPTTIDSYRKQRKNCLQEIINTPVNELDNGRMQTAINLDSIRLSPKTIRSAYGLFTTSIRMFYPDFRLQVTLPSMQKKIKRLPDVKDVIQAVQNTEIELPCMLALWLSLRMSEVRGIRYSDITGDVLTIRSTIVTVSGEHIQKNQMKTFGSTRQLHIPPYLMHLIENQRENAKSDDDHIITMTGQAIYKRFVRLIERKGLPHITFHDLRHLNASVMLMLGIPDKYAMERGGWSSNYTLQQVYQHTFSSKRLEVDKQIDDYFNQIIDEMP